MRRDSMRSLSARGELIVPIKLIEALGLDYQVKVSLQYTASLIILHNIPEHPKAEYHNILFDMYGIITIPKELLEKLSWYEGDKIGIYLADKKTIVLQADKDCIKESRSPRRYGRYL